MDTRSERLRTLAAIALLCAGTSGCIFVVADEDMGHDDEHHSHHHAGFGTATTSTASTTPEAPRADARKLLEHVKRLASDEFAGRQPGSRGEDLTVEYLTRTMQSIGLEPAGKGGGWTQDVPLVGFRAQAQNRFRGKGGEVSLACPDECVLLTRHLVDEVAVDGSQLVFVGYGIVAPEMGWDDYKGVDVRGKTLVMLINDPPVPDPEDPSKLDESMFGGRAMTYYGRWTYKYEIAAEKGAAAVLIVHETAAASYPYDVVRNSWSGENFELESADKNTGRAKVEGWLRHDKAAELVELGGADLAELERAAVSRDFRPVPLDCRATLKVQNSSMRKVASRNVLGRLRGSDLARAGETIVYTAHWDHFGTDTSKSGDGIYNGAVDNATGVGGVLEIARVLAAGPRPPRSFVFLFVTAEERGLLGSRWYAENPLVPLEQTLCDINMDSLNVWGPTVDIESIGYGASTLDDVLIEAAAAKNRVVRADSQPERGGYYRSDHFEFAKRGVPALYADSGTQFVGRAPGFGAEKSAEYTAERYHEPSDEVLPEWDLSGAAADLDLLAEVGRRVAHATGWPEWKTGNEFRARREAMLRAAQQ